MKTRMIGCAWAALVLGAPSARSQDAGQVRAPYRITGTVSTARGTPVFAADVAVVERDSAVRRVRSDSVGQFQIDALSASEVRLRVRRLGFQRRDVVVRPGKDERNVRVFVTLEPTATNLDTVLVDDVAGPEIPDSRLAAFRERASTNSFGRFVTEEMLARMRPNNISDALRGMSGVLVRAAGPRHLGNIVRLRGCGARDESPERTGPLVWLDGVRLPGVELDDAVSGADVAAVEVYHSFAGVPSQYLDRTAVCGTILVWTRVR